MGFALVQVIGNLGADAESRFTPNGTPVVTFRLAVNHGEDQTDWYRVSVWGKLGENVGQYLVKGRHVFVAGRLRATTYAKKDGGTSTGLDINANDIQLLGGAKAAETAPAAAPDEDTVPW